MIKSLRKKHRQVWLVMLLLLPAGIVLSWLVIPNQAPVRLLQFSNTALLSEITQTKELPNYTVNIRTNNSHSDWQLEWKNKTVLSVPSAVIYRLKDTTFDIGHAQLIGRIEASGTYIFPLIGNDTGFGMNHFILYDFIHQQIIDHINFQP